MKFLTRYIQGMLFILFAVISFTLTFNAQKIVEAKQLQTTPTPTTSLTPIPTSVVITPVIQKSTAPKQIKTSAPTQTILPTPKETPDTRCIISIDGNRYDVTNFRTIHSGGDIFQCGTDMSAIFWNRHNQTQLSLMQKYRL